LKERSPTYLELGPDLLNSALVVAEREARHRINEENSRPPYPGVASGADRARRC
jgi:hypothetical protein